MKIKNLVIMGTLLLPVTVLAVTPPPVPNEVCTLGNACSYTIFGMTKRIITTPDIPLFSYYKCSVTSGDGLGNLRVENVTAPANINYKISADLAHSPFLSFSNNSTSKRGSITYDLRNTDFYRHSVIYRCERVTTTGRSG